MYSNIVNRALYAWDCFYRYECPEGEYAEPLRRQQSAKWSMET